MIDWGLPTISNAYCFGHNFVPNCQKYAFGDA